MVRHSETPSEHASELRSSVRLDFLEALKPQVLCEILRPHDAFFQRRSIDVSQTEPDDALLVRLYELLNGDDPEIPMRLRRTIVHLTAMATEAGFEALVEAAREHGEEHFARRAAVLTNHELAAETYLRLPHVFKTARGRIRSHAPQRYTEYLPRTLASVDEAQLRARLAQFKAALRRHFFDRTGSDYCRVLPSTARHDHDLLVCHAGCPTTSSHIEPDGKVRVARGWNEVRDVVLIDRHTGRLAVCAQSPTDRDCYREVVGEVFFGDSGRYTHGPVYTGSPLLEQGLSALRTEGIEGLQRVDVVEVRLRRKGARTDRVWLHPEPGLLASPEWACAKQRSDVTYLRLAFHVEGRSYPADVEIVPPNSIAFDRRFVAHYAYTFLPRRGFMLRSEGYSSSPRGYGST